MTEAALITSHLLIVPFYIASLVHVFRECQRMHDGAIRHTIMVALVWWPLGYLLWIIWWPGSFRRWLTVVRGGLSWNARQPLGDWKVTSQEDAPSTSRGMKILKKIIASFCDHT